jgi:hypothetical protein
MTNTERTEERALSTADMAAAGAPRDEDRRPRTDEADSAVGIQPARARDEQPAPLMADDAATAFRDRWQDVQADFVDDPQNAVERADALVAEVMQQLAQEFARERQGLEKQWSGGGEASTEDLRLALQRYRSFFTRLLTI